MAVKTTATLNDLLAVIKEHDTQLAYQPMLAETGAAAALTRHAP